MEKKQYRHEEKYLISYSDYVILRNRLQHIAKYDPHVGKDNKYYIHSIYFDNFNDKVLQEKMDGVSYREKYRIRYYNDDRQNFTLEKKIKNMNLCLKLQCPLNYKQVKDILDNNISWMKDDNNELIRDFYKDLLRSQLKPRVIVSYTREPFIYKYGNVRITFDSNITTSNFTKINLDTNMYQLSTKDNDYQLILEVKYDNYLPSVIFDILHIDNLRLTSFSKYGISRKFG